MMSQPQSKIIIKYKNIEYIWHNKIWITKKFITVSTSLSQELTRYAIESGLISEDDVGEKVFKERDYKEVPKIKEDA